LVDLKKSEDEEKKVKAPLSDDDSYYDEESDGEEDDDEEQNSSDEAFEEQFKIGKGFDDDDEIDLTEITEDDVVEKKLEALQTKLEDEYKKGFNDERDPNKIINLKTLRLTFLNIGPKLQNLEFFENLENLFIQHNNIETIGLHSLQFNTNLQILNLANNAITRVEGVEHLTQLALLDLSFNKIEECTPSKDLPPNLSYLRMNNNPVAENDEDTYRK